MTAAGDDTLELTLDGGPMTGRTGSGRTGSERTCIVNRRPAPPSALLRFVVGPDGAVVPDVKARLPGRGAWVTATRAAVDEAVRRRLFARAFRREVAVDPGLAGLVDRLLEAQALAALSLANKAGAVIAGFAKVETAVAGEDVAGLVHAADAGEDGVRKLGQALRRRWGEQAVNMPRVTLFTSSQLDLALGRMNVIHAALLAGGPSGNFLARCTALEVFRTGDMTGRTASGSRERAETMNNQDQPTGAGPEPYDR